MPFRKKASLKKSPYVLVLIYYTCNQLQNVQDYSYLTGDVKTTCIIEHELKHF